MEAEPRMKGSRLPSLVDPHGLVESLMGPSGWSFAKMRPRILHLPGKK